MKKVLLVDGDEEVSSALSNLLTKIGFDVTLANDVRSALKLIVSDQFDVLVSDLHMPSAGDGFTVIGAMHHSNPEAINLLLTSFPEMDIAAQTIARQADEILIKPMPTAELVAAINRRLEAGRNPTTTVESVAAILEDSAEATIAAWLARVERTPALASTAVSEPRRTGHLPELLGDLVLRLQSSIPAGTHHGPQSAAARRHGVLRREQGYTVPMIVEESRLLQVSIFETLQNNLARIDFSRVLGDVMIIADEVDAQLRQAVEAFLVSAAEFQNHPLPHQPMGSPEDSGST